eukprot:1613236-Amphidinium_carterae.1
MALKTAEIPQLSYIMLETQVKSKGTVPGVYAVQACVYNWHGALQHWLKPNDWKDAKGQERSYHHNHGNANLRVLSTANLVDYTAILFLMVAEHITKTT